MMTMSIAIIIGLLSGMIAQIKKELMSIAWHPSRYWDWCMSEDEKRDTEALWAYIWTFFVSCGRIQKNVFLSIKYDPGPTLRT